MMRKIFSRIFLVIEWSCRVISDCRSKRTTRWTIWISTSVETRSFALSREHINERTIQDLAKFLLCQWESVTESMPIVTTARTTDNIIWSESQSQLLDPPLLFFTWLWRLFRLIAWYKNLHIIIRSIPHQEDPSVHLRDTWLLLRGFGIVWSLCAQCCFFSYVLLNNCFLVSENHFRSFAKRCLKYHLLNDINAKFLIFVERFSSLHWSRICFKSQ